jgi:hypothetical protein
LTGQSNLDETSDKGESGDAYVLRYNGKKPQYPDEASQEMSQLTDGEYDRVRKEEERSRSKAEREMLVHANKLEPDAPSSFTIRK